MSFKPFECEDRWLGVGLILGLLGLGYLSLKLLLGRPVDGLSFVLAVLGLAFVVGAVYVGYRTFGAFTLEYWVDRNAVTLVWGATRQVIPLGQIRRVVPTPDASPEQGPSLWHWPCPHRRRVGYTGFGTVNAYASRSIDQQIILVTDSENYALSPADPTGFVEALQQRFNLGVARAVQPELRRPPLWTWPLWRDRLALFLIGAGLLGVLILFAALSFRYPYLSSDLPLHFDVTGMPDRIAPKEGLFALPVIGLTTWLVNTAAGIWIYRRVQRGAATLLWAGALVVQGIAGLALFNLMRW